MKTKEVGVIIVGSGGAGQRCAIELYEQGLTDIIIIGDRPFSDPHTTQARGGINAALATMDHEDSPLIHAVDTYLEGQCLAHPALVEALTKEAPGAIDDLVRRGANFHKEQNGELTQRFFGAHSYRRTVFSGDQTGLEMIKTLSRRSQELGIPFLEETYVFKLLTHENTVTGVLAIQDEEIIHIQAPVVVFATGGFSNVYRRSSSRSGENFGDGIWVAFEAGAVIGDLEMVQFHPTGLLYPEEKSGELVTEAVRGEGGILLNKNKERFMEKYDPQKRELSTRDVVARANFQEIHEGRGTPNGGVWLDISHRSKEYILERLPKMHSMILEYNNVDISKDPVEVAPTTHYTMGGIKFDPESMKTAITHFYVAGECTMGVHGANRLGGNSLMETMVFGKRVAETILSNREHIVEGTKRETPEVTLPLTIDPQGIDAEQAIKEIRALVREYAGIVRKEDELIYLQKKLTERKTILTRKGIKSTGTTKQNIIMSTRISAIIDLATLICRGAYERKESRGGHYRTDYLHLDENYTKNLLHQKRNQTINSRREGLPAASSRLQQGIDKANEAKRLANYTHQE